MQGMTKRFLITVLLCAGLLPFPTLAQGTSDKAPMVCGANDKKIEDAACLKKFKGLFTRNGDKLTLQLDSGKSKTYVANNAACINHNVEKCVAFRVMQYFPQTQSYLIARGYYEGADFLFISRRTGSELEVSNILALSPNAKFLVGIDQDETGERKFDIAIWSMATDPPRQEFKYAAKQYENWEIAAWKDDTHINMKAWINGEKSYDQEAELVRKAKGWSLVLGKKTDRPR